MTGFGMLLLCASWVNIALRLHEPILKAIAEGFGIQAILTIVAVVIYSACCIVPYISNVIIVGISLFGSYCFPEMTITFVCTAFGICFLLSELSEPDKK